MVMVVPPAMVVVRAEMVMVPPAVMMAPAVVATAMVMVVPSMVMMVVLGLPQEAGTILHRNRPARCHGRGGSVRAEGEDRQNRQGDQGKGARHGLSSSMRNERPAVSP